MREAFIHSALRTPIGRHGGALASVRADDLAAIPLQAVVARSGADPRAIDDVIYGCANGAGEDNRNVARMAALIAGLPVEVPGQTINRLCGSGMQAVVAAFHAIRAAEGDLFIAGGVESMTRSPYVMLKTDEAWARGAPAIADTTIGWRFTNKKLKPEWTISLGETAEKVGAEWNVARADQDALAAESQRRAARAIEAGWFSDEIVPVEIVGRKGEIARVERDEHPRADSTVEKLAKLKPAFKKDGAVTAGNSSGINDGAAALIVASEIAGRALKTPPLARIVASAVAGVDPSVMGIGPIPAVRKALTRADLRVGDIDLFEINEAFAAQALACLRDLGIDPAKTNIHGGAIALGHPLGATGARMLVTLAHALKRTGGRYGLASMCIGVGQGIATIIERVG